MIDKNEKYIKELLKDVSLSSPSGNFTENVMQNISYMKKPVIEESKSFLMKYKFMLIFSFTFISIFVIVYFFTDGQSEIIAENFPVKQVDYSFLDKVKEFFTFETNIEISYKYIIFTIAASLLFFLDKIIPGISKKFIKHTDL